MFLSLRPMIDRSPVAQWVKRWPSDLPALVRDPPEADIFQIVNGVPLHTASSYRPDMTGTLLKGHKISQVIHPSIHPMSGANLPPVLA